MILRNSVDALGSQIVARKPATAVTGPGRSDLANSFPPIERLLHGRLQVSQKLPSVLSLCLSTLTVISSLTVHHHKYPSSNVSQICWLGLSINDLIALTSVVPAPGFL